MMNAFSETSRFGRCSEDVTLGVGSWFDMSSTGKYKSWAAL